MPGILIVFPLEHLVNRPVPDIDPPRNHPLQIPRPFLMQGNRPKRIVLQHPDQTFCPVIQMGRFQLSNNL